MSRNFILCNRSFTDHNRNVVAHCLAKIVKLDLIFLAFHITNVYNGRISTYRLICPLSISAKCPTSPLLSSNLKGIHFSLYNCKTKNGYHFFKNGKSHLIFIHLSNLKLQLSSEKKNKLLTIFFHHKKTV